VTPVVGVALDGGCASGVLVLDNVVVRNAMGPADDLGALVAVLAVGRTDLDRVVVAADEPLSGLADPTGLPRVGVLRIGAPATTTIPPFTGWPPSLVDPLRGPVALVGGGHLYDGREFAPLDHEAVSAFGVACRHAGVGAVAVTGVDAHMNPAHEQRARDLLTDVLGLSVPVVMSHDCGGGGLLERENATVLGAACAAAAARFTEQAIRSLDDAGIDADLYLVGGDGTVFPAGWAARHPLAVLGAGHAAARVGAGFLTGLDRFVVVDAGAESIVVSAQTPDGPVGTGTFGEVRGVRTSLPGRRSVMVGSGPGCAVSSEAALHAAVRRVAPGTAHGPILLIGPGAGSVPQDPTAAAAAVETSQFTTIRRPEQGELAAAVGAAAGEASGTVDRVYLYGDGGREECVAAARRSARELAIRRGADPRTVRVGEVREGAMTYVAVRCIRLRVTATGPVMATGGPTPDDS
jgi:N-methylhydantoinase A/oxoprolinase/acetone carboxylase beta subunit